MSENLPTPATNINFEEARRRLDELEPVSRLGHEYSRTERGTEHEDGTPETDGDHVVHLGIMAIAYAMKYRPDLDPGRLALYILFHDIDEAKVGDTPTLGADEGALRAKDELEAKGRAMVESDLEDYREFVELLRSLHDLERPEDRFGKAFDKLTPGFMHCLNNGLTLEKFGVSSREELLEANRATDEKMRTYAADHPDVIAMRAAMHERVGDNAFGDEE